MSIRLYSLLKTIVNFLLALISFFLVLRIILKLFSTNPRTPFVAWIYSVSDFLITPFANIAPNLPVQTGILDIVALITFIAYLIVGYLLFSFIDGLNTEPMEIEEEYPSSTVHYHELPKRKVRVK